jgi:hypothetical protein
MSSDWVMVGALAAQAGADERLRAQIAAPNLKSFTDTPDPS